LARDVQIPELAILHMFTIFTARRYSSAVYAVVVCLSFWLIDILWSVHVFCFC